MLCTLFFKWPNRVLWKRSFSDKCKCPKRVVKITFEVPQKMIEHASRVWGVQQVATMTQTYTHTNTQMKTILASLLQQEVKKSQSWLCDYVSGHKAHTCQCKLANIRMLAVKGGLLLIWLSFSLPHNSSFHPLLRTWFTQSQSAIKSIAQGWATINLYVNKTISYDPLFPPLRLGCPAPPRRGAL